MRRTAILLFGLVTYALAFATMLYAIGFVGDFWPVLGWRGPWFRSVSLGGPATALAPALVIDAFLVGIFGLQHSGMARERFKRWWTRVVPEPIQRSAFVVATSLCLIFLFWQWRPIDTAILWSLSGWPAAILIATSLVGWGIVVLSTFLVDHFDLFGVRQVWFAFRGTPLPQIEFRTPLLYQVTRHPLYLGFLIAFWATPFMTLGHLVFAAAMTAYILVGIQLEERDLVGVLGDTYRRYRRRVPMLIPVPRSRRE